MYKAEMDKADRGHFDNSPTSQTLLGKAYHAVAIHPLEKEAGPTLPQNVVVDCIWRTGGSAVGCCKMYAASGKSRMDMA